MKLQWLLLAVLLLPAVAANHQSVASEPPPEIVNGATIIHQESQAVEGLTWSSATLLVANFTVAEQSTFTSINRTHYVEIVLSIYWTETSVGVGRIDARMDGVAIDDCFMFARTIDGRFLGVVGAQQAQQGGAHHALLCEAPGLSNGTHELSLILTTHSGTPNNPAVLDYAVSIVQLDYQVIPMDINITNLEFWLPLLFWFGLTLWFLVRLDYFPAVATTVMVIGGFLTTAPWSFALGIFLVLIGVWIQVMARRGVFRGVDE